MLVAYSRRGIPVCCASENGEAPCSIEHGAFLTSRTKDFSEQLLGDFDVGEVTITATVWGGWSAPDVLFGECSSLEVGVTHGDFRALGQCVTSANIDFVTDVGAVLLGVIAAGACGRVGAVVPIGPTGQPEPALAEVDAQVLVRSELEADLGGADIFEHDVILSRPRALKSVEALESVVGEVR